MTPKFAFHLKRKVGHPHVRRWAFLISGAIPVFGLVIGFISLVHSRNKTLASRDLTSSQRLLPPPDRALPVQTVRYTLYPQGIYPQKTTAHKGVVAIAVDDLVGGSTVLVEKINGDDRVSLGQARRSKGHWRGRGFLNLTPGDYRVFIAERPDHRAKLTVEH